jgi:hypothetical protein
VGRRLRVFWYVLVVGVSVAMAEKPGGKGGISFGRDIFPVIKRNCLPCHAEDQFNPSELSLDTYDLLMAGGKHGPPIVAGKPKESILMQKLSGKPAFGDPMPLDAKKKKGEVQTKRLTEEEIRLLTDWIAQGAKNN